MKPKSTKLIGFKTRLFNQYTSGYLNGNPNASSQEIDETFNKCLNKMIRNAGETARKNKQSGKWWITTEGRCRVREIWNSEYDLTNSIPLIYLNEIERLENEIRRLNALLSVIQMGNSNI